MYVCVFVTYVMGRHTPPSIVDTKTYQHTKVLLALHHCLLHQVAHAVTAPVSGYL